MDASALLTKQGWRGAGHGLGSSGSGIPKPLLISNKQDALGIGKKKLQVADQWWMRAYDTGLKELGTGKQTALSSIRQNGVNRGGLYGFFVKGEGMAGTISDSSGGTGPTSTSTSTPATTPEAGSTPEPGKSEKKRLREGDADGRRKKRKEEDVAQSKGKDKKSAKGRRSADGEKHAATAEDPKALRRAAKKALRQQRALREAKSKETSADEETEAESGSSKPAAETTKSERGKEKRTREGKGTESQGEPSKDISDKKLKKYAAKAAEKGLTVEAYLAKRERKTEKAKK